MLNKLQLNNLIISNKKKIQQCRIQTLNKLVRKVKKLKKSENVKSKNQLERAVECIAELKKLKYAELMRRTLVLENPVSVITNGRALPEEIAIALLAMNKTMQGMVKDFKTSLNLNDTNERWRHEIMWRSKRRMKIERTEQKRENRKALKVQKALARKRVEWLEKQGMTSNDVIKNVEDVIDDEERKPNNSTLGIWKEEPLYEDVEQQSRSVQLNRKCEKTKRNESNNGTISSPKSHNKIKKDKPKVSVEIDLNSEATELSDKLAKEKSSKATRDTPTPTIQSNVDDATHVVDPFFITDTGDSYLSTAIAKPNAYTDLGEKEPMKHFSKIGGKQIRNSQNTKRQTKRSVDHISYNKNKEESEQALHPSWVAKQKLKAVITNFQGKKIKFDEDSNSENPKSLKPVNMKNNTKNVEPENLHPSWAAKQKLKPIITAFQGKKTTFDFDDDN